MGQYHKKISMQDIADKLSISKNAVSLALSDKPGVSIELKKRILKTAQDLNYNGLNKSEVKKNNNLLLLIPEYIRNDVYFYSEVYWAIEKEAYSCGYKTVITVVNKDMEKELILPELYYEMNFSGALIVGVISREYINKVMETKLPLVIVDNYYDDMDLNAIVTANEEGAFRIVKYLIDNGHKEIGYIGSIQMTSSLYERWNGYNKAMLQSGLKVNEQFCILDNSPLEDLLNNPDEFGEYLDKFDAYPTAWFCGGDRIAIALIAALGRRNIKVPEDISVVGFDDIDISNIIVPRLTTIRVERKKMGSEAVDFIINLITNNDGNKKVSLYGKLIIRDSVRLLK